MEERLPAPDFRRVFDVAPAPFLLLTPDFTIVHANEERLAVTETTLEQNVGRNLFEVFPDNPDDPTADGMRNLRVSLERVVQTRQPHTMAIQRYDIPMPDGTYEERFWSPRNVPILDEAGQVVMVLHHSEDLTPYIRDRDAARSEAARGAKWRERVEEIEADLFERARELARANAELTGANERESRAARSLSGLATAVSALAAAETIEEVLEAVSAHGRGILAAALLVVALPETGATLNLTGLDDLRVHWLSRPAPESGVADTTPEADELLPVTSPTPVAMAAQGHRVLVEDVDQAPPQPSDGLDQVLAPIRGLAALPLRAGSSSFGSLTIGWTEPQVFDPDRVRVLEAFASQCGQAVERAVRLEVERRQAKATRRLAEALQRSLLTDPPPLEGLEVAVRYQPAGQEAQVGGDWYDAFRRPAGGAVLVVGDVAGHDRQAAAGMAQLRNVLRGIVQASGDAPAAWLSVLDRAMEDLSVDTIATAVVALMEPVEPEHGGRLLRWSAAGHLPPVLAAPGESPRLLDEASDVLLGLTQGSARREASTRLAAGSLLVLYSDGLVERRREPIDEGLDRLLASVAERSGDDVDDLCEKLLAELATEVDDDVAILAVRVR